MKVTAILPVYNGQQFLKQAIDSVLSQTLRPHEVIAIDDGSTDGSLKILRAYERDVSTHVQANSGVAASRNRGAQLASGELIAFIDQDDVWYGHKLERQVDLVASSEDVAFVYSDFDLIDGQGRITRRNALATMKAQWMRPFIGGQLHPYPSTVLMKRSLFVEANGFDSGFKENTHEDVELWVRLYDMVPFSFIPESLIQYRWDREHRKSKKRSLEVDSFNYLHLYERLDARFHKDPSKRESLDWILAVVHARRGKELALAGEFKEARYHFEEARRLDPSGKRHRWRYVRTFFPSGLRRFLFPR
jgi:glycosyltransferase involved in cell wall biosynthesis